MHVSIFSARFCRLAALLANSGHPCCAEAEISALPQAHSALIHWCRRRPWASLSATARLQWLLNFQHDLIPRSATWRADCDSHRLRSPHKKQIATVIRLAPTCSLAAIQITPKHRRKTNCSTGTFAEKHSSRQSTVWSGTYGTC